MTRISVVIPNYNRAQVIGKTITNMLQQTLPPQQVIVIDDGSTDHSVDVIKRFGDRVTLIQQSNKGPGAARNAGLKIAKGEFIQFMDSDDLVSFNKLQVQAQTLKDQNADIVYGPWLKAWMADQWLRPQDVVLQQKPLPVTRSPLLWFLTQWSMIFQQCLVRKSLLDQVRGYREDLRLYEDGDLFVRLLLVGAKLVHESETLTLYRLEDHGKLTSSGSQNSRKIRDKAYFYALVIAQLNNHPEHHHLLEHPEMQFHIWQSFIELKMLPEAQAPEGIHHLEARAGNSAAFIMHLRKWLNQKQSGLQQCLKGHRWPSSYQVGAITPHQRHLVADLGFSLL